MVAKTLHNFHLPLSHELYRQLKKEAHGSGQSITGLARSAIQFWLKQKRRAALHREIAEYAVKNAATPVDLDDELENAAVELLMDGDMP